MPPNVALLIGFVVVWYAFKSAPRRGVVSPPGLWWPTFWYLACATRMLGVWLARWGVPLPSSGGGASDGSIVDALFFLSLTLIGFVVLARRQFSWGAAVAANRWVALLFAFMALSILWSQYPYVSFKRYVKVVGSVTMALVVLTNENPLESLFTVLRRCLYIHLPMSIVCIKYFRDIGLTYDYSGESHAWQGISTSKNDLGQVVMLAVLYFAWEIHRHWRQLGWKNLNSFYLLMAIGLLKGSEGAISMTSLSVSIFAVAVLLRLQMLRSQPKAARRFVYLVFFGMAGLVTLVLVHSVVMFSENSVFGTLITTFGRNITFTDRTFIWSDVYDAASQHKLFGVGFGGFWIGREANIPWDDKMSWVLGQAHNGYVDSYLQIGLVGVSLLAAVLLTTPSRLLATLSEDYDFTCFRITLFLTILYVNITETTYLRGDHHLWFILQLVIWIVPAAKPRFAAPVCRSVSREPSNLELAGLPA